MKFVSKNYWWVVALICIFLFSFYIRFVNIVPDRLLSFDPIFQYRFTKYFVEWGRLPLWDELSYYVGREITISNYPPLMWYLTAIFYFFLKNFNLSLFTTAAYTSALYGALITIPAFLVGRELSNKYGGLMSAALLGAAPQILIRTFGSSYDNDQMVLLFMILTIYLGLYALRKRTVASVSLAIIGFTAYMITWFTFLYPFVILCISVVVYFVLSYILSRKKFSNKIKSGLSENIFQLKEFMNLIKVLFVIFIGLLFTNLLVTNFNLNITIFEALNALIGFAQRAEAWIVTISIAELQPFNILNLDGWLLAMGRFVTGYNIIDAIVFLSFIFALIFGIINSFKAKNLFLTSFLITLFLIATVTTMRGIRFTEFSSAFFIILISVGFGSLIEWSKKDNLLKATSSGLCLLIVIISLLLSSQIAQNLGPDINPNWDSAWEFLRTKTPELSIIGTWWDPGHMITGLAERRVVADGAHCSGECLYTINDRITDLGKIMATDNENESISLINKYRGDSPEVYWIASDDLIGKFQWLQYFGTGCDARTESKCPLYMQIPESSRSFDNVGNIVFRNYDLGQQTRIMVYNTQIPIPIFVQGINAALFDEFIIYNDTQAVSIKFSEEEINSLLTALKSLERDLNVRFTNQTIPMTVWIPRHYSYIVLIPPTLRNSVFTKMFMLEGQGLEHFKQVFRNEQVKIYEVVY